ncbi:YoaK family protein [Micromonospora sp. RTGN7]|uniref:YoaK family protein n=1 Tax=Micromonospora sp. RTGN7 TaxID=3016526 RepID=UPI0029FEFE24|nr:YoaK family protein [Micromonospora sp. RTGN7]
MGNPEPSHTSADRAKPPDPKDSFSEFRCPLLVLALTTGIAGFLDAFAFLRYGVFVANQSGNVILFGIGAVGQHPAWPAAAASLVGFAAGAALSTWVRLMASRWSSSARGIAAAVLTMAFWAVLNVLLEYGRHGTVGKIVLAAVGGLAMGSLATLFVRTAGIASTITYQSGTVAKTGERIAAWLAGPSADRRRARRALLLGLMMLASYALGGGIGALAQQRPLLAPTWATLALAIVTLSLARPARSRP